MAYNPRLALESWLAGCSLEQMHHYMGLAYNLARTAGDAGEVPVGALVIDRQGQILGQGENRRQRDHDPTAHAEVLALRAASQTLGSWHLDDCALFVTLEPCPMCAGAIVAARLGLLVYGADDPKTGAVRSVLNLPASKASHHHLPVLAGIEADRCGQLLRQWFQDRRLRP
jgi:tRNA(adenine34) deaminase